jgi:hypothetical protein
VRSLPGTVITFSMPRGLATISTCGRLGKQNLTSVSKDEGLVRAQAQDGRPSNSRRTKGGSEIISNLSRIVPTMPLISTQTGTSTLMSFFCSPEKNQLPLSTAPSSLLPRTTHYSKPHMNDQMSIRPFTSRRRQPPISKSRLNIDEFARIGRFGFLGQRDLSACRIL